MEKGNIDNFPDEILIKIFMDSDVKDIIHLCRVSKRFNTICSDQAIWSRKVDKDFSSSLQNIIDSLRSRGFMDKDIYHILYDGKELRTTLEKQLIFGLNLGDDDLLAKFDYYIEREPEGLQMQEYHQQTTMYHSFYKLSIIEIAEITDAQGAAFPLMTIIPAPESDIKLLTKEGNDYPINGAYMISFPYLSVINSIYLSLLYRKGISINFFNLVSIEKMIAHPQGEDVTIGTIGLFFDYCHFTNHENVIANSDTLSFEKYMLQVFHTKLVMTQKYGFRDGGKFSFFFSGVEDNDTWKGQRLKDADFWAYRVGQTTLYFKPSDYIVKMLPDLIRQKSVSPRLYLDVGHTGGEPKLGRGELIRSFHHVSLWHFLQQRDPTRDRQYGADRSSLFDKLTGFVISKQSVDPYFLLQSPTYFGKFMIPKELIGDSKVIILGEI